MILLVHLLFGAAIGSVVKNIPLALVLAFLSHYFLDSFPHIDYPIKNTEKNQWRAILLGAQKVALDFCLGVLLILIFSNNQPVIYFCAFLAILPDGLTVLKYLTPEPGNKTSAKSWAQKKISAIEDSPQSRSKILEAHYRFHQKIHFLKNKKISNFWRVTNQIIFVVISMVLMNKF